MTNHESKLAQFSKRAEAIDKRLIEIGLERSELSIAAAEGTDTAIKNIASLDDEVSALSRETDILEAATKQTLTLQQQEAAAAIEQDRKRREQNTKNIIAALNSADIDAWANAGRVLLEARNNHLRQLVREKVIAENLLQRCMSKSGPSACCKAAGLDKYIALEFVSNAATGTLASYDKVLGHSAASAKARFKLKEDQPQPEAAAS